MPNKLRRNSNFAQGLLQLGEQKRRTEDVEKACESFVAALLCVRNAWRCAALLVKLFKASGCYSENLAQAKDLLGDILSNMQLLPVGLGDAEAIACNIETISNRPKTIGRISHEVVELCVKLNYSIEEANDFLALAFRADNELSFARVVFQAVHAMCTVHVDITS